MLLLFTRHVIDSYPIIKQSIPRLKAAYQRLIPDEWLSVQPMSLESFDRGPDILYTFQQRGANSKLFQAAFDSYNQNSSPVRQVMLYYHLAEHLAPTGIFGSRSTYGDFEFVSLLRPPFAPVYPYQMGAFVFRAAGEGGDDKDSVYLPLTFAKGRRSKVDAVANIDVKLMMQTPMVLLNSS